MKITIDFDGKNLTQLLKAAHFGAWMKNATKAGEEVDADMEEFEQYVLGCAFNAGEKTRIKVLPEGGYELTEEFDGLLYEQIQEYDEDIFWELLVDRLAQRDYWQKNPAKAKAAADESEKAISERMAAVEREK